MSTTRGRSLLVAAALCLAGAAVAPPPVALAAPTASAQRDARKAWETGKREMARRRWSQAAASFREADELHPRAQHKLDLARALLRGGELREASDVLDAITAKDAQREGVRRAADDLRVQLERRLATIVVEVDGPGADVDVEVEVDGEAVQPGDVVRVAPGKHLVKARAPGWVSMEQTVTLKERQTEAVAFRLERDPDAPAPAAAAGEADTGDDDQEEDEDEEGDAVDDGGTLLPAAIAWGVGGAGIALGTVFGVFAFDEAEKAKVGCVDNVCPASSADAIEASRTNGTASTICFSVGGAGLVTGVVLALVLGGGDAPEPEASSASVRPVIGPAGAGVIGRF